jgi:hypothetical protein
MAADSTYAFEYRADGRKVYIRETRTVEGLSKTFDSDLNESDAAYVASSANTNPRLKQLLSLCLQALKGDRPLRQAEIDELLATPGIKV